MCTEPAHVCPDYITPRPPASSVFGDSACEKKGEDLSRGTLKDFDVTDELSTIDVPVLITGGGNDLCTPSIAKVMHDAIPGSRRILFRDGLTPEYWR